MTQEDYFNIILDHMSVTICWECKKYTFDRKHWRKFDLAQLSLIGQLMIGNSVLLFLNGLLIF